MERWCLFLDRKENFKNAILFKLIYELNLISINSSTGFFMDLTMQW